MGTVKFLNYILKTMAIRKSNLTFKNLFDIENSNVPMRIISKRVDRITSNLIYRTKLISRIDM